MKPITELVLASHNAGKLKELQAMLGSHIKVRAVSEFSSIEPEETGLSFIENAILKARHAAQVSGLPALADDSGLAVDALGGAPGIYSARYADGQGDAANNAKLLDVLKAVPDTERGAQFVCVLALVRHAAHRSSPPSSLSICSMLGRLVCSSAGKDSISLYSAMPIGWVLSPNAYSATTLFWLLHINRPMVGLSCSLLIWRSTAVR